jgi:hypothetical protein
MGSNLYRDAAGEGRDGRHAQQNRPQRRPRARPDHAYRLVSGGACEEQSEPHMALAAGGAPGRSQRDAHHRECRAALLRETGVKLGTPSRKDFVERTRELTAGDPVLTNLTEPLLTILATMLPEFARLSKHLGVSSMW